MTSSHTSFHDTDLPDELAMAVRREQIFRTDIVETGSGFEFRNATHGAPRRRYTLDTGPRPLSELRTLARFFEARRGRQYGFLLRDWLETHSGVGDAPTASDQSLSALDDDGLVFGLQITHTQGGVSWQRNIVKPEADTLLLAKDGTPLVSGTDFTLDASQGIVRLTQSLAENEELTAGFYFYVPVRFDADQIEMTRLSGDLANLTPLPLVEIPLSRVVQ